jgi:hypothetical protein
MTIEVAQLSGDTVELLFNPDEEELYVGANLSIADRHNHGLIIQIIELRIIPPPRDAPPQGGRRPLPRGAPGATATIGAAPKRKSFPSPKPFSPRRHVAVAKIRKMIDLDWRSWDGRIPPRDVAVTKVTDDEVLHRCVPYTPRPLRLGATQAGADFSIDATLIGGINLLAGAQEAGISLLGQHIASALAVAGVPCVIFDTRGSYTPRDTAPQSLPEQSTTISRLIHLVPGENLKLGWHQLGSAGMISLLTRFGLPATAALYFESHLARRTACESPAHAVTEPHRFLGIDELVRIARDIESAGETVTGGAILSCLEAIRQTRLVANVVTETTTWTDSYAQIRDGGILAIDLSRLDSRLRRGLVQSITDMLWLPSTPEGMPPADRAPCVFLDEAQALATRHLIDTLSRLARRRHMTGFLVTERVSSLDAALLHQVDHLFLRRLASDRDARQLAQGGIIDAETLQTLARRLPQGHSLLIGEATGGYPIIFALGSAASGRMSEARPGPPDASVKTLETTAGGRRQMPPMQTYPQAPPAAEQSLPLFPEATPSVITDPTPPHPESQDKELQPPLPTLAQVSATWDHIVKRAARRRRILETILSTARPLRLAGKQVVLGFPPQQRFQQELIQSEDYRHLIEEELRKAFGAELEVTTELYPV